LACFFSCNIIINNNRSNIHAKILEAVLKGQSRTFKNTLAAAAENRQLRINKPFEVKGLRAVIRKTYGPARQYCYFTGIIMDNKINVYYYK
jgi:hypothetical protein